ncbi:MAG: hypothetical protein AAGM22_28755 [Acidobacteriota bacterium]
MRPQIPPSVCRTFLRFGTASAIAFGALFTSADGARAQIAPVQLSALQAVGGTADGVQTVAGGSYVLYTGDTSRFGQKELWSIDTSDGSVRKLSPELADREGVVGFWPSPDGTQVAFEVADLRNSELFQDRIYTVALDGTDLVLLDGPVDLEHDFLRDARWTPDSLTVVHRGSLPGEGNIRRLFASPATGGPTLDLTGAVDPISFGDNGLDGFDLSADGTQVAFWGDFNFINRTRLYTVPVTGGNRVAFTDFLDDFEDTIYAAITPDSQTLVFVVNAQGILLFKAPVAGGDLTSLPTSQPAGFWTQWENPMLFAPDSSRFIYASTDRRVFSQGLDGSAPIQMGGDSANNLQLLQWGLSADATKVIVLDSLSPATSLWATPLTGPPFKVSPDTGLGTRIQRYALSPDPDRLIFSANESLFRTDLYSTSTLAVGATRLTPGAPAGPDGVRDDFFATADGARVIYRADQLDFGLVEAFSVPVGGGPSIRLNLDVAGAGSNKGEGSVVRVYPGPTASSVLYAAGQDAAAVNELFQVEAAGGIPEKVSAPFTGVIGGEVNSFAVTADGAYAVYTADQRTFRQTEIFSVATAGGTPVVLNPDITGASDVETFRVDPLSNFVVFRVDGQLWSSPVDGSTPAVRLAPTRTFNLDFDITPDGQHVIAAGPDGSDTRLFRIPIAGGEAVRLTPDTVDYFLASFNSPPNFEISSDSQRLTFIANQQAGFGTQVASVPIAGGDTLLLAPPGLQSVRALDASDDGSYVTFFAQESGSGDRFLYGSPTDVADPVQLGPSLGASATPAFATDPDGSHVAFISGGDLFAVQTDTGTTLNLLEGLAGTAQSFQFVQGGDGIVLNRGAASFILSSTDLFSVDGSTVTPLTSGFPSAQVFEQIISDDSVVMRVDQNSINSAPQDPVIYRIAFDGTPGAILSEPGTNLTAGALLLSTDGEAVAFEDAANRLWFVPFTGGAQTLVSGSDTVEREIQLAGKLFFRGWTDPATPLVELYAVDVDGSTLFVDGFESGDVSRWDVAAP